MRKGNVDEVLEGLYQVEKEVTNMNILGMHKSNLVDCLQSAKQSLKKSLR